MPVEAARVDERDGHHLGAPIDADDAEVLSPVAGEPCSGGAAAGAEGAGEGEAQPTSAVQPPTTRSRRPSL